MGDGAAFHGLLVLVGQGPWCTARLVAHEVICMENLANVKCSVKSLKPRR